MSLKILFPEEVEELAIALDGISEATAQAAHDGQESLEAFRLGVQVAMAAMVKAAGGRPVTQLIKSMGPIDQPDRVHPPTNRSAEPSLSPCPLKGIYPGESNGYHCRFYRGRCPMLTNPVYNYLTCPGWHHYEAERCQNVCLH
jgi:hypothetical protein